MTDGSTGPAPSDRLAPMMQPDVPIVTPPVELTAESRTDLEDACTRHAEAGAAGVVFALWAGGLAMGATVLVGIIVGGSMGGILGILLAAPVLATLRVIGRYIYCRIYDLDPFAEPEEEEPAPKPGLLKNVQKRTLDWLRFITH